jgi:hypothetical protein
MSKWLALAQQQIGSATRVPTAPLVTKSSVSGSVGTGGANGTEPEYEMSERQSSHNSRGPCLQRYPTKQTGVSRLGTYAACAYSVTSQYVRSRTNRS